MKAEQPMYIRIYWYTEQVKWSTNLFEYKGEPSSKAKYDI